MIAIFLTISRHEKVLFFWGFRLTRKPSMWMPLRLRELWLGSASAVSSLYPKRKLRSIGFIWNYRRYQYDIYVWTCLYIYILYNICDDLMIYLTIWRSFIIVRGFRFQVSHLYGAKPSRWWWPRLLVVVKRWALGGCWSRSHPDISVSVDQWLEIVKHLEDVFLNLWVWIGILFMCVWLCACFFDVMCGLCVDVITMSQSIHNPGSSKWPRLDP